MQTFLPDENFVESARQLDDKRLGKQRLEALQILRTLFGEQDTWKNHPAVLMWKGYEGSLFVYALAMILEWRGRGFKDNQIGVWEDLKNKYIMKVSTFKKPPWVGNMDFHKSHRSNLLRKFPEHYRKFWPNECDDLPYYWPVRKGE